MKDAKESEEKLINLFIVIDKRKKNDFTFQFL